jgi:hypothetical protein
MTLYQFTPQQMWEIAAILLTLSAIGAAIIGTLTLAGMALVRFIRRRL